MAAVADLLDGASDGPYADSLRRQTEKIEHPDLTPSARMLAMMRETGEGFFTFAERLSHVHGRGFQAMSLPPDRLAFFERLARESIARQQAIEAADEVDFDTFLERYFAQS
jgi:glutamate--cysteine ligase